MTGLLPLLLLMAAVAQGASQLSLSTLANVRQSSDSSATTLAAKAVDASTTTFATTQNLTDSWWEAELPTPYTMTRIEVVNTTVSPARLAGLVLRVQDIRDQTVYSTTLTNPGSGATWSVDLPAGLRGRIVRIGLEGGAANGAGDRVVSLAEVKVYGDPILLNLSTSLADAYSVTQSSTLSGGAYPAANALDGSSDTFTHTENTPNSYWQMTYAKDVPVQRIEVVNRADCCNARLTGLTLRILDGSNNTVASATIGATAAGATFTFTPPVGTIGRAIKIGLENGATNGDGTYYVTLAEVKVYSAAVLQSTNADAANTYPAANAVDGNTSTYARTDGTTANNWWKQVFATDKRIDRIEVVARSTSGTGNRVGNNVLRILDSSGNTVVSTVTTNPGDGGTYTYDAPAGTVGRAVKIGLEDGALNSGGNLIVNFAELRVIEESVTSTFPNLALNQPSYMVRLQDSLNPASYGNDGNLSTAIASTTQTVDAYWEVDLGQPYALYNVKTTIPSGFNARMNLTTLRLFDGNHDSVFERKLSSTGLTYDTLLDGPRRARYLRIGLEDKTKTGSAPEFYISLNEAEVYGRPLSDVGILSFRSSATNTTPGQAVSLLWDVEDVREVRVEPGVGSTGALTGLNGEGSVSVSPAAPTEYVLIATNGCGNSFSAVTVEAGGAAPPPQITEFVADNKYSLEDGDGAASDWIEIHNPRNSPLDLAGYGLSDDPATPFKWVMPSAVVPAHGFLVVFASQRATPVDPAGNLHAPFKLAADTGSVVLTAPGGVTASAILNYPPQREDLAYGLTLQGAERFLEPTPRQFNHATSYAGWLHETAFSVERGYKDAPFTLDVTTPDAGAQILYSTDGKEPYLPWTASMAVTSSRSVRASTARTDFKPPRTMTHTYIFVNDIITASYMKTLITQDAQYTTRLRAGLTDLLTLSVNFPSTLTYDEQAGSVEVIWPDTGAHVHANCGVMRFANAWTDFTKRSVRLKFRKQYGAAKLVAPLYAGYERGWPAIDQFDSLDIRSGSQDMSQRGFYMSPVFVDDTMNDMGSLNPHGRFVNLYVNGAYYGKFHLRERLIDQFLADYLGGKVTDYVTVRGNDNVGTVWVPGTPEPVNRASWDRVRSLASSYNAVKPYLDVPNYIDFMLLWLYGNCENEYRCAGPVEAGSGFKFYISDPDGFLRTTSADNTGTNGPGGLFAKLVADTNPDFKMLLADRIYKHFFHDGAMTPAKMSARLTARMNQIYNAMVPECARWYDMTSRTPANWASAEAAVQTGLFPGRTTQLLGYLRSRGLYPASVNPPEFNQHGGLVAPGFVPVVTAGTGTVYYTLDGGDPRLPGGNVSPTALVWSAGAVTINDDTTIKTRLRNGTTWSALNEVTFTRMGRVAASVANTLVTELHYNPDSAAGSEFIELMNISTNRVDFTNVRFTEGVAYTFPAGFSLDPGEFALVVENTARFAATYQTPGLPWYQSELIVAGQYTSGKLNNSGERVALLASNNTEIAAFEYQSGGLWPARAGGDGSSLELADPAGTPSAQPARNTALGTAANWRSSLLRHGSPGRIDTAVKEVVIHEVLSHTDAGPDWVELFNRGASPVDLSGKYLTDDPARPFRFQIPANTVLAPGGYLSFTSDQLGFGFSELGSDLQLLEAASTNVVRYLDTVDVPAMEREETSGLHIRTDGVSDFTELLLNTRDAANSRPRVGPLVLSEIQYKPASGAVEFVEIANISGATVPLFDPAVPADTWQLSGAVDFSFPAGVSLPPGRTLIVCATTPAAFRSATGVDPGVQVFGPWSGNLNNAGESLKLRRPGDPEPDGFVPYYRVDHVTYEPAAPWPVPPPEGGCSIERFPVQAYGNDPGHWRLSAPGGTPGALTANRPPVINVNGRTTVPAGLPMTLSIFAADQDAPWQQAGVEMPDPPPGATFLPVSGQFAWTPPEDAWPAQVDLQVIATDDGIPALSVTNTVTVTLTEPFRIVTDAGSGFFTAPTIPGEFYQIEYSSALTLPDWHWLETRQGVLGGVLEINDPSMQTEPPLPHPLAAGSAGLSLPGRGLRQPAAAVLLAACREFPRGHEPCGFGEIRTRSRRPSFPEGTHSVAGG
ncbi:MAG: lamin tail domain-containing protein [Kiritimatiellia bacterium]